MCIGSKKKRSKSYVNHLYRRARQLILIKSHLLYVTTQFDRVFTPKPEPNKVRSEKNDGRGQCKKCTRMMARIRLSRFPRLLSLLLLHACRLSPHFAAAVGGGGKIPCRWSGKALPIMNKMDQKQERVVWKIALHLLALFLRQLFLLCLNSSPSRS